MKEATDSSFLCLKPVKSVGFNSVTPEKKNWWNCLSKLAQYNMEFAGNVVNQAKADLDKDKENNQTLSTSWLPTSPNCRRNLLTCSIVETSPSYPNCSLITSAIIEFQSTCWSTAGIYWGETMFVEFVIIAGCGDVGVIGSSDVLVGPPDWVSAESLLALKWLPAVEPRD